MLWTFKCPNPAFITTSNITSNPLCKRARQTSLSLLKQVKKWSRLGNNLARINGELGHFLDDADRNDPQYVRNIVSLHKEVRETVKDIMRIQDRAAGNTNETMNAQTINILKVELSKESPEVWTRIRSKLMGGEDWMVGGPEGSTAGMRFNPRESAEELQGDSQVGREDSR